MSKFQVKLAGDWKDYCLQEDKILKRAFMAGFPIAKFQLRRQIYVYDFRRMVQFNTDSGKERAIRQPRGWKPPSKPLVPAGPTTVVNVPPGSPGTTIQVPHPRVKGAFISVNVPVSAKPGQAMLVPVPSKSHAAAAPAGPTTPGPRGKHAAVKPAPCPVPPAAVATPMLAPIPSVADSRKSAWTTGGKLAAGTAAIVGVGGAAVGGAILGEHIAEHGLGTTVEGAGEVIEDFAVDAGEFTIDAAEDVGDFVMDLF